LTLPSGYIADGAEVAPDVTVAPGSVIHAGARIERGCAVGAGAVIHAGVKLAQDCVIEDNVVLGKRARLRAGSSASGEEPGQLLIAARVTICCGAIVYAGAELGADVIIGDQAQVRERTSIGARAVIGRGSAIEFGVRVGARALIQSDVYVAAGAVLEEDVFLGPHVMTTNDDTMGRHPRGEALRGPVFRRACRVGGAAVLVPGVEIGEEAFVAAGSVVTRNVGAREVVMGVPARVLRRVGDEDLLERWQ
jgi:acetyltransferase-like isoleucine patch superfamily enzyme